MIRFDDLEGPYIAVISKVRPLYFAANEILHNSHPANPSPATFGGDPQCPLVQIGQ